MRTPIDRFPISKRDGSNVQPSTPSRKQRVAPQVSSENHLSSSVPWAAHESRLQNIYLSNYAVGLDQRFNSALQKQHSWYSDIEREAEQQRVEQDRINQEVRSNWTRQVEAKKREQDELERALRESREQRRLEQQELRWLEQERIRRKKEEADRIRGLEQEREQERIRREKEEADRIRRQRLRECIVCLDEYDLSIMSELACHHWYCTEHIQEAFRVAWTSRRPFQCCQQIIPIDSLPDLFSGSFQAEYSLWLEERATQNPLYCYDRHCSVFLPLRFSEGPDAIRCHLCGKSTCRHCRRAVHLGKVCAADVDAQAVRVMASGRGWKACPSCSEMIEKESGCIHMICRCGTQFCYRCGRLYSICPGIC